MRFTTVMRSRDCSTDMKQTQPDEQITDVGNRQLSIIYCISPFNGIVDKQSMVKSPLSTGIAIANSMIGSSMILFPVTFNQTGIFVNVLFVLLMAALMALTCKLLVDQLNNSEKDIGQSIKRRLGPSFSFLFGLLSSITLFLVSSVFFLLAVDVFYDVFLELFGEVSISEKMFKIILMGVFASLNYLPDLKVFFKLSPIAMGCLIISTLILIISIAFNTDNINRDFLSIKSLSAKDLLSVASINAFAFICHPSVGPIVQEHDNRQEKTKAVYYGYGMTIILYLLVGILGAMSIYGRVPPMQKSSYNIIDYFSGEFQAPIIGFLTFIYLFMISPIFPFVSKNQALELIPEQRRERIPKLWFKTTVAFSVLWIATNTAFILLDTAATSVISFISTVAVYFITYFLPVYMTIKVGNYISQAASNSLNESLFNPQQKNKSTEDTKDNLANNNTSMLTDVQDESKPALKKWQRILYSSVLVYGSVMLVLELISFLV